MFSDILLTVDFDRTLTAPDSSIPERNLRAIEYFMENGGTFTVNTGRSVPMSAKNIIGRVPVNAPLLLYNGSAAYDVATEELRQCYPLPVEPRMFIEELQRQFPEFNVEIHGVKAHYLFQQDTDWEIYNDTSCCAWEYVSLDRIPQPFLKATLNGHFRGHTVASMYDATDGERRLFDEAMVWLKDNYGDKIDAFRACTRIIDLHAKGCNKLASARTLQKELGKKILVCVGDAENDLTMLTGADYAYCPADGVIADRFENVCKCADGAVADVIYKKIPEILNKEP